MRILSSFESPSAIKRWEMPAPVAADTPLTVAELIVRYWRFVQTYYVKNGRPTSEVASVKMAVRFVRRLYGLTPAYEFSPKKLKAVREAMTQAERYDEDPAWFADQPRVSFQINIERLTEYT